MASMKKMGSSHRANWNACGKRRSVGIPLHSITWASSSSKETKFPKMPRMLSAGSRNRQNRVINTHNMLSVKFTCSERTRPKTLELLEYGFSDPQTREISMRNILWNTWMTTELPLLRNRSSACCIIWRTSSGSRLLPPLPAACDLELTESCGGKSGKRKLQWATSPMTTKNQ